MGKKEKQKITLVINLQILAFTENIFIDIRKYEIRMRTVPNILKSKVHNRQALEKLLTVLKAVQKV